MNLFKRFCFWPTFFIAQLIGLALVSWHLLAQFHFAYPLGYQLLNLNQHITQYAPLNRYKEDFEFTSASEHWRLFGEISDAVHTSGKGLAQISYTLKNGQLTALMHEAEIIHLQDVANLIDRFYFIGILSLLLWASLIAIAHQQKLQLPSLKKILLGFLAGSLLASVILVAIGPTAVFYWLHEQIFPDGHQWFFYYQDSLMTTLMKAPDIFAFIAIVLLSLLLLLWCASLYGINHFLQRTTSRAFRAKTRK